MANLCFFEMRIRGSKEGCLSFFNALTQNGDVYMGRGADASIANQREENGICVMEITGCCKWSVTSALTENAISMRENPKMWCFENADSEKLEFATLEEACIKYNVDCEVYSEEEGMQFQEHIFIEDGQTEIDDCVDYVTICTGDFETKEEAEDALGREITSNEWEDKDSFISNGGFEWDFAF